MRESQGVDGCPLECPFDPNESFEDLTKPVGPPPLFQSLEFPQPMYVPMDLGTCR